MQPKKELAMWIFGYLTFLSILFTLDATFFFGGSNSLLKLYPIYVIVRGVFGDIDASTYFLSSLTLTFVLFGITCIFISQDPLTLLIRKIVSETPSEENQADSSLESSLSTLEMINHSLTHLSIDLNEVKNNMRSLKDSMETMKIEMRKPTAKVGDLERERIRTRKCPFCGKDIPTEI